MLESDRSLLTLWKGFKTTDIHVIPIDDTSVHALDRACRCKPRVEIRGSSFVYVHKAFDGRDFLETYLPIPGAMYGGWLIMESTSNEKEWQLL